MICGRWRCIVNNWILVEVRSRLHVSGKLSGRGGRGESIGGVSVMGKVFGDGEGEVLGEGIGERKVLGEGKVSGWGKLSGK